MNRKGSAWSAALETLEFLEKNKVKGYVIGGAVRDTILSREIEDIDIVLEGAPDIVWSLFPHAVQPSSSFPVFIVPRHGYVFEITTFHPDKESLQMNLEHRDFTMNAMTVEISGNLIDPYGGQSDINRRLIRSVSSPLQRMKEDPLRKLRAFRFVSEFNFSLEESTWQAVCADGIGLQDTAKERIQREIEKILEGKACSRALELLLASGVISDFPDSIKPEYILTNQKSPELEDFSTIEEKWAVFFFLLYSEQACCFVNSWPIKKRIRSRIHYIIKMCTANPGGVNWDTEMVYQNGWRTAIQIETVSQWLTGVQDNKRLEHILNLAQSLPIVSRDDLQVDGRDIVRQHPCLPGRWIGYLLDYLEEEVLYGRTANKRDELLSLVKEKLSHER
ncbi:hypothetical protein [Salibacterium qingdaonense]|uniref:tRNA nucleotidyltransferase (CCA-adding enzyme) n=1 Tax=Salibacterium qingdaonense TaxID=266892 RepID=A0A1I4JYX6_9BACI|nr:hypothetical protein [Salibacterium qingdaonense]SFL71541.1 tRNA nucleotidyltransferase (CCA-adding enzyme) [Salibacterium qingdaonense]